MTPAATRRLARSAQVVPVVTTVLAMIATPLAGRGSPVRRVLSSVVVTGLFATTTVLSGRRWGAPRAAVAASSVAVLTGAVEKIGTVTGVPFGVYRYSGVLRPTIAGVPMIVPMAWFAMAMPAREAAHAALGPRSSRLTRIVVGAAALTAWDLFLDPQMVGEGYWQWNRRGRYRGIPLSNFAGWFVTGLGAMAMLEVVLPPRAEPAPELVAEYGYMATMQTLGFALFFRDRTVATVGGIGMLPVAAAAGLRLVRRRRG